MHSKSRPPLENESRTDAYAALRLQEYRRYTFGRNLSGAGEAMQSVVVVWELYARTHSSLTLGYVGLVQVIPVFLFAIVAGHIADRYPRKTIVVVTQLLSSLCTILLAVLSSVHAPVSLFLFCLFLGMTCRAFCNPARGAILPQIVPAGILANAVSWDTSVRRVAVMLGQAMGGFLLDWTGRPAFAALLPGVVVALRTASTTHVIGKPDSALPAFIYLLTAACGTLSALTISTIRIHEPHDELPFKRQTLEWSTLLDGIRYIRTNRIILETISLDLFAVLFGGATALLPVYQKDILHLGPEALGWMRASSSFGALVTAVTCAHMRGFKHPGRAMLWAVFGFGIATIAFGLSRNVILSVIALAALGALDMVSVVVRQTLIQTLTINKMRGRVNAVNAIFVNSSNEIGAFESGVVAHLAGPVFSVVSGGIGSVIIAATAAVKWPALRSYSSGRQ